MAGTKSKLTTIPTRRYEMPKVGTAQILGTEVEVHANSIGIWRIELEGQSLGSGDSLDKAIAQARQKMNLSRVDVSVPFYTMDGKKGVATKIHGKTQNVMARV